jgi:hypothetical protein
MQKRLWWGVAESVFGGSLESGFWFCVAAFDRNLASVAVKVFSHLIYFIKIFYKFFTSNAICKENEEINCTTFQHLKGLFSSTSTGHTTLVEILNAVQKTD